MFTCLFLCYFDEFITVMIWESRVKVVVMKSFQIVKIYYNVFYSERV